MEERVKNDAYKADSNNVFRDFVISQLRKLFIY